MASVFRHTLTAFVLVFLVDHVASQYLRWSKIPGDTYFPENATEGLQLWCCFEATNIGAATTHPITYTVDSTHFEIGGSQRNALFLRAPFDREETATIQLTVQANTKSNAGAAIKIEHLVYLFVLDVNDNIPQFTRNGSQGSGNKQYLTKILENTPVGTIFYKDEVQGTDADASGAYSKLEFRCDPDGDQKKQNNSAEAKIACEFFGVTTHQLPGGQGRYSARFTLLKPLNFRKKEKYVMTLMLRDFKADGTTPEHEVNGLLIIEVIDIQNEPPVCYRPVIDATVKDGTLKNSMITQVQAEDRDMDDPIDKNPVRFSLAKVVPRADNMFKILQFNCTANQQFPKSYCAGLITNNTIDREKHSNVSTYEVFILAKEFDKTTGKYLGYNTTCKVIVNINDVNDNKPQFDPPTKVLNISESHTGAVLIVKIEDSDLPVNARFNTTLTQPFGAFQIDLPNPHTKLAILQIFIKNRAMIDYEVPKYRLQVIRIVAAEAKPGHTVTATYTIHVQDENDNAPVFPQKSYSASVAENSVAGTPVITITASDKDSDKYGPLEYKIEGDSKQRFNIDKLTGRITVATSNSIDYEDQPKFNIFVVATDKGKKEVTVKLEINVIDKNDKNPVYENLLYRTKISEKQTNLDPPVNVTAIDQETHNVFYSIVAGNTNDNAFVVNRNTGVLSVRRPLVYSETPGGRGFFEVIIEANDGGTPPGKSNTTVRVAVIDVNDYPPKFNKGSYTGSIEETAKPDHPVLQVVATDQDGGANGEIIYRIESGSDDQFFIRPQTGWIIKTSQRSLDYDLQKQYNMVVLATDKGSPQMTGSVNVLITVLDKNNKKPVFNPSVHYTSLSADARAGKVIKLAPATDKDTNSNLTYHIPWNSFQVTDINSRLIVGSQIVDQIMVDNKGLVSLRTDLRPDGAVQFSFYVTAEDENAEPRKTQTATATILVNIFKDEGETPVFNSPWTPKNPFFTQFIPEEQGIQSLVLALSARDPKTKEWLHNFEKVRNSDPRGFFTVGRTSGEVRLGKRVDYEVLSPKVLKVEVVVTTKDGRNATALITVNIQDINDNSPKFALQEFTFSIPENAPYRAIVGNVRATDIDSGRFGQITYVLTGARSDRFMIDQATGDILVGGRLDRETYPRYQLLVNAVDNPTASRGRKSGIATVTINLLDVNDNSPSFERNEYNMYTLESAPPDTSLGKVLATDPDEGTNSQIFYSIAGGNSQDLGSPTQGFWKIDQISGVIRTARSLTGFNRGLPYDALVEAIDNGIPTRLRSVATVHITIQNPQAYIGRPTFIIPSPGMVKLIPEEQPAGFFVLQCRASDSNGPVSALRYSLLSTGNPDHAKFRIDTISGNLTTAEVLDREKQENYNIQIGVIDGTGNTSDIMLTVRLVDIDDHAPSFFDCNNDAKNPLTGSVHENEKPPKFVLTALACDLDAAPNNLLFFKITCGNELKHFTIGKRNGNIHTDGHLDREKIHKYTLCVTVYSADPDVARAKRAAKAIRSSSIGVVIEVLDRDDNGPTYIFIPKKTFTTGLLINAPYNSLVIDAHAKDLDGAANSVTFYRLLNMQFLSGGTIRRAPGAFQVDMNTGEIRTSIASYADYTNGYFTLLIEARDTLGRRDNATVLIYILMQSQRLKFIFTKTPSDVRDFYQKFMNDVSYVVKARITTDLIRYSVGDAADFDFKKTDVCFHMVKDNDIVQYFGATTLLSNNNAELKKVYDTYGMSQIGLCNIGVKTYTRYTEITFWWVIIILALFLFFFVLIMVFVIVCLWNRYRKFMLTNTSYIVKMGANGQLITDQVASLDVTSTALTTSALSSSEKTTKIAYDEVDISFPVTTGGAALETTVMTSTEAGYDNYGYDNAETLGMTTFRAEDAGASSFTTTEVSNTTDAVDRMVIMGAVAGGSTSTVTKETTTIDSTSGATGSLSTDMMTINSGETPTVLRKVITTTTTVTEEMVEEPAETSGVVITEITGDVPQRSIPAMLPYGVGLEHYESDDGEMYAVIRR